MWVIVYSHDNFDTHYAVQFLLGEEMRDTGGGSRCMTNASYVVTVSASINVT